MSASTNPGSIVIVSPGSMLIGADLAAMAAENLAYVESGLVTIEGGTFLMGCETGEDDEKPVHRATVDAFRLGVNPVTNEEYRRFLDKLGNRRFVLIGAHPITGVENVLALGDAEAAVRAAVQSDRLFELFPGAGDILKTGGLRAFADGLKVVEMVDHNLPPGFDGPGQPALNVTWFQSFIYAFLNGGMLPTEWQWEFAARVVKGSDTLREYATASGLLIIDGVKQAHYDEKVPIDVNDPRYEALPNGLRHMTGNVWEWMQNWYGPYPQGPETNPTGPVSGNRKSLRGGSWFSFPLYIRAAIRPRGNPGACDGVIGFRLAAPPKSSGLQ